MTTWYRIFVNLIFSMTRLISELFLFAVKKKNQINKCTRNKLYGIFISKPLWGVHLYIHVHYELYLTRETVLRRHKSDTLQQTESQNSTLCIIQGDQHKLGKIQFFSMRAITKSLCKSIQCGDVELSVTPNAWWELSERTEVSLN